MLISPKSAISASRHQSTSRSVLALPAQTSLLGLAAWLRVAQPRRRGKCSGKWRTTRSLAVVLAGRSTWWWRSAGWRNPVLVHGNEYGLDFKKAMGFKQDMDWISSRVEWPAPGTARSAETVAFCRWGLIAMKGGVEKIRRVIVALVRAQAEVGGQALHITVSPLGTGDV